MLAHPLPGVSPADQKDHAKKFVRKERETLGQYCEDLGLWDAASRDAWLSSGGGDPLPWIWAHIRTVKICLELTALIQDRSEEGAEEFLKQFRSNRSATPPYYDLNVAILHKIESRGVQWSCDQRKGADRWTALDFAKYIRRDLINENISRIRIALGPVGRSEDSFFEYRALIEMVYWHLHNIATEGKLRRCLECRAFFIQRDAREKFCRTGLVKDQSYCGIKYRARIAMRKLRQKKRGGRKH
jgi:hypothetical protein